MHHDLQPYFAPDASHEWVETDMKKEASTWMKPMTKIRASKIVEIPANWHLDDWPPLQPMPGRAGTVSHISLTYLWLLSRWLIGSYRSTDSSVHTKWKDCGLSSLTLHMKNMIVSFSLCLFIRKSAGSLRLSRCMNGTSLVEALKLITEILSIINYINNHDGVEWMPFGDMAKEFLEGRVKGVGIEGGADVDTKAD
jgi:hypothetical protein